MKLAWVLHDLYEVDYRSLGRNYVRALTMVLRSGIALSYVMHKTPYLHPIVGGRSVDHLKENIEALGIELSDAGIDEIEGAIPFDIGFPHNFAARRRIADRSGPLGGGDVWLTQIFGHFDFVEQQRPIKNGLHEDDLAKM